MTKAMFMFGVNKQKKITHGLTLPLDARMLPLREGQDIKRFYYFGICG